MLGFNIIFALIFIELEWASVVPLRRRPNMQTTAVTGLNSISNITYRASPCGIRSGRVYESEKEMEPQQIIDFDRKQRLNQCIFNSIESIAFRLQLCRI